MTRIDSIKAGIDEALETWRATGHTANIILVHATVFDMIGPEYRNIRVVPAIWEDPDGFEVVTSAPWVIPEVGNGWLCPDKPGPELLGAVDRALPKDPWPDAMFEAIRTQHLARVK